MESHWQCQVCTLLNPPGTERCSACESLNPEAVASSASPLAVFVDPVVAALSDAKEACNRINSEATLKVLSALVGNAADNPDDPKYRGPVSKGKDRIRSLIVEVSGASAILRAAGFEEDDSCFMIRDVSIDRLTKVRRLLQDRESAVAGARLVESVSSGSAEATDSSAVAAASSSKLPAVIRKKPKFDENLLKEIEAEKHSNARWAAGASAGSGASAAEPPMPTEHAEQGASRPAPPPRSDYMRLRLRLPLGGQMDLNVEHNQTVAGFMSMLTARTGVPVYHQQLRFGFPPVKIKGTSDDRGRLLSEAGMMDGDAVHLDNLNDIFLGKLESGAFTMRQLLEDLPSGDAGHDTGMLFIEALEVLGIGLEEQDFWAVVRTRMRSLLNGECQSSTEVEELKAGLFVLQRLFNSYDPRQRLSLCLECLMDRRGDGEDNAVHIECDRGNLFDSVTTQVLALSRKELIRDMEVHFKDEQGVDAGGLTRNMFSEFAQCLAESEPLLWSLTGRGSLQPTADIIAEGAKHSSRLSSAELYRACGRVFSMAVLHDCTLGRQLSRSFVRLLIGDPPQQLADLQAELNYEAGDNEPDFRGGRDILDRPLSESGLSGVLTLTRAISGQPKAQEVELVPGGAKIEVTDANKERWLTALLDHKLVLSQQFAAAAFRDGIIDVFGGSGHTCPLLCLLSADELVELWGGRGMEEKDVARLQGVATVSPYVERQAEWLWYVLKNDYDDELRAKVLRFVTGSSRVGRDGVQSFVIEPADGGDERLPSAMTCGNMLQLPRYSSRFVLAERLRTAAESCVSFQLS